MNQYSRFDSISFGKVQRISASGRVLAATAIAWHRPAASRHPCSTMYTADSPSGFRRKCFALEGSLGCQVPRRPRGFVRHVPPGPPVLAACEGMRAAHSSCPGSGERIERPPGGKERALPPSAPGRCRRGQSLGTRTNPNRTASRLKRSADREQTRVPYPSGSRWKRRGCGTSPSEQDHPFGY